MFSGRSWAAFAAITGLLLLLPAATASAQETAPKPLVVDADVALALSLGHNALATDADGLPRIERASVSQRALRVLVAAAMPNRPIRTDDVAWLISQQLTSGGWGFGEGHAHTGQHPAWTDIINTHLAVAALADAATLGHDVPVDVFARATDYCLAAQNDDGGWGYTPMGAEPFRVRGASHGSATTAALAILTDTTREDAAQGEQRESAIGRGVIWLRSRFTAADEPGWIWGRQRQRLHYLYGLQRFANHRGIGSLAGLSLRQEVAAGILSAQHPDGIWSTSNNDLVDTCVGILALTETRRPILVNAMNFTERNGDEVAHWVAHCSDTFARPYSWQTVDPAGDPAATPAASILYLMVGEQLEVPGDWPGAMRSFAEGGGTIVVAAGTDVSDDLAQIAEQLAAMLGPWPVLDKIDDHVILSAKHSLTPSHADGVKVVGNGLRPVGVVLPKSIVEELQDGPRESSRRIFELVANVTVSATGFDPPLGRSPLAATGQDRFRTFQSIKVARAMHDGDWYLAPRAMAALNDALAGALSLGVEEVPAIALKDPPPKKTLLWLTTSGRASFNAFERQTLRSWLRGGGTIFIDAAAGNERGLKTARALVEKMLDEGALVPIELDHPLITGEFGGGIGCDLRHVAYAPSVTDPPVGVRLLGAEVDGRLAVIVSPYGVTPAIANLPAVGAKTLSPRDARRLGINLLLWSVGGR